MRHYFVLLASLTVLSGCATVAPTVTPEPDPTYPPVKQTTVAEPRFYHGLRYGSEAQFNPLTEVLNEGFDMFRTDNHPRKLGDFPFQRASANVLRSLIHPDSAFRAFGWNNTLKDELLPLSWGVSGGPQWLANYSCHFLGSGMVSARMVEWYEQQGVPHPVAMSAITMFTAHFTNEIVEDGGAETRNHPLDAVVDIYLFDVAGFLMFRNERVQKLFSEKLELTNWQGQATITARDGTLENTYQEFVLRVPLPKTQKLRGIIGWGPYSMAGLSYGSRDGTSVSLAGGGDIKSPTDPETGKKDYSVKPYGGVFIDRRGSLLGSLVVKNSREVLASANLYPGVINIRGTTFGLWGQLLNDHSWRVGIVPAFGLGVGGKH